MTPEQFFKRMFLDVGLARSNANKGKLALVAADLMVEVLSNVHLGYAAGVEFYLARVRDDPDAKASLKELFTFSDEELARISEQPEPQLMGPQAFAANVSLALAHQDEAAAHGALWHLTATTLRQFGYGEGADAVEVRFGLAEPG